MSYKALIYSDLQATDGHERCYNDPATSLQLWRVRRFYSELKKIFDAEKCDCLWDLGDTTDDRSYIPMTAIDAVLEGLEAFPDHELNIKLIGNHEQYVRDCTKHIGRMFARKFAVIATNDVITVGETLIICVAYPVADSSVNTWLTKTAYAHRNYERRILLGHFQIQGCTLNSGLAATGVDLSVLKKFTLGLLGHVHKPQTMGAVHYVGSPFQQNFGEKGETKRVGVLDVETLDLKWITMQGFPEYRVVDFPTWCKSIRKDEEHRYQVILRDPKEAEAYYAHPLMNYAEPTYDYQMDTKTEEAAAQRRAWTKDDVMRRWVERTPPGGYGIRASVEDVLNYGKLIAGDV